VAQRPLVGADRGHAARRRRGAVSPRRLLRALAGGTLFGVLLVAGVATVIAAATGVASTPPGAWVTRITPLPGVAFRVNVPALLRLATAQVAQRLLDGRSVTTRYGRLRFGRDGEALTVTCAPCRVDHPRLAAETVTVEQAQLKLARADAQTLRGELAAGAAVLRFTARLQRDRIDIDWTLPPTDIAAAYRIFAAAVPDAARARIDGRLASSGSLRLPQRRARVELEIEGFAVEGLGTEGLASGPVAFTCRDSYGVPQPRRLVAGEGRWVSATQSGALLAGAVLAAEDQRFFEHEGYDRIEIARVLGEVDEQGIARGASTITQQLARTLFTGGERTVARKLREMLYAVEMERTLGKRGILALYLNTVDWGPGICGADAAARRYFGKRPGELTPLEAAWLASILPNPGQAYVGEFLTGRADSAGAVRVLRQMRELPRAQRERSASQTLVFAAPPPPIAARLAAR